MDVPSVGFLGVQGVVFTKKSPPAKNALPPRPGLEAAFGRVLLFQGYRKRIYGESSDPTEVPFSSFFGSVGRGFRYKPPINILLFICKINIFCFMEKKRKTILIYSIGLILGALAGYLYYHFVGCASGTCPITSRPIPSTLFGAVFGAALGGLFIPKKKKPEKEGR